MKDASPDAEASETLEALRAEHRTLDERIEEGGGRLDAVTLRRMKKRKLVLKDQIARLEDMLYPDIIA